MLVRTKKYLISLLVLLCVTLLTALGIVLLAPEKQLAHADAANFVITVNGGEEQSFADFNDAWAAVKADGVTKATLVMHADYDMANLKPTYNGTLLVGGMELDFDLNGYTLTGVYYSQIFYVQGKDGKIGKLTLSDGSASQTGRITGNRCALYIFEDGEAVMNGGTISGISDAGVRLQGFTSKFTMNGGKITDCTSNSQYGGGVFADNSTFIMTGGEISGNKSSNGAGVYLFFTKMYVSGAVKITGNKKVNSSGDETTLNVHVMYSDSKIIVDGKLEDSAGNKAQIGVTPYSSNLTTIIDYNKYNSGVAPSTYFIPDEEGKCVGVSGKIGTHRADWSWISNEDGHYRFCANDCGAKFDESAHNYVDGACSACNAKASFIVSVNDVNTNYNSIVSAWSAANTAGTATITMYADASLTQFLYVSPDTNINITLDLNGHTIKGSSAWIAIQISGESSTFTLKDSAGGGKITGAMGGIAVTDAATVNMEGGEISGNASTSIGGGVYINDNGTFNMSGGTIKGNTAQTMSGGVYVGTNSTFNVSGLVQIYENTIDNKANNVELSYGRKIAIVDDLDENTRINVYRESAGDVATGYSQSEAPTNYFVSDNEQLNCVYNDNGTVKFAVHAYGNWETTLAPTCIAVGSKKHTCTGCSNEETEDIAIDPDAHTWNDDGEITKHPTCTATGVKSFTCTLDPAHTKTEDIAIDPDAHSFGEWQSEVAATCTATGTKAHKDCTLCNKHFDNENAEISDLTIAIDPDAHTWDPQSVRVEPTCTTDGSVTGTCTECGTTDTEVLIKLGHDLERHEAQAETCTQIGWNEYDTCSRCDHTTYSEREPLGHDFETEFTVDAAATCTTKGSKSKHCSRCDEKSEVTEIPLNAHTLTHVERVEATTTSNGNIEYWTCSICNKKFSDENGETEIADIVIPMLKAELVKPSENGGAHEVIVTTPNGFAPEIELVVTEIAKENYAQYETIANTVNGEINLVYDVTLKSAGVTIQPDGTLTIKLRIPEQLQGKNFKLFHLHGSEATDMVYTVDDNYAVVNTDRLSAFIFVGEKAIAATPADDDGLSAGAIAGITIGVIIFVLLAAYVALYFTLYRKGVLKGKAFDVIYKPMNAISKKKKQEEK